MVKPETEKNRQPTTISEKEGEKGKYEAKVLDLARVARVTAGGKHFRFRAVVVVGDKQGRVGVGVAKGQDVAQAVEKAERLAQKNFVTVPIVRGTIPHEVEAKFSAAKVLLKPQSEGRGLVAGGTVRTICQLAGISNVSSKVLGGTRNKLNNALATIKAFQKLKVQNTRLPESLVKTDDKQDKEARVENKPN